MGGVGLLGLLLGILDYARIIILKRLEISIFIVKTLGYFSRNAICRRQVVSPRRRAVPCCTPPVRGNVGVDCGDSVVD